MIPLFSHPDTPPCLHEFGEEGYQDPAAVLGLEVRLGAIELLLVDVARAVGVEWGQGVAVVRILLLEGGDLRLQ